MIADLLLLLLLAAALWLHIRETDRRFHRLEISRRLGGRP